MFFLPYRVNPAGWEWARSGVEDTQYLHGHCVRESCSASSHAILSEPRPPPGPDSRLYHQLITPRNGDYRDNTGSEMPLPQSQAQVGCGK